jgi:uncharacterized protein
MKKTDIQRLGNFLASADRPEGTLRFHELQGFLFAIACSPETIAPSEWLPLIGNDESLNFADEKEAQEILGLVMDFYNETNMAVLERSNSLPAGCVFASDISQNFENTSSIAQWSRGFASGHDWLAELWEGYLFDELDEECGATLMVLSFFSSRQLAEAYFEEMKPGKCASGDETFEEFAKTMRRMFPDALASYAHLGRSIFEAIQEQESGERQPAVSSKIGRNEPCPCGSGKKYKKCCGAAVH